MSNIRKKYQSGIVSLLFILFMAVIATFVLTVGYSRLILALQRGKGASDSLITAYHAESEINDLVIRLIDGYLDEGDFPFSRDYVLSDGTRIEISGDTDEDEQTLTVISSRAFAVNEIRAVRELHEESKNEKLDIVLMLDCTGSMSGDSGRGTSRIYEQEQAALNFVQSLSELSFSNRINFGMGVFKTDAAWLQTTDGRDITTDARIDFDEIRQAIDAGFGDLWSNSEACNLARVSNTSLGTALTFAQDHLDDVRKPNTKQVEILITDGEPTSRKPDSRCAVDSFCPYQDSVCAEGAVYGWTCYGRRNCEPDESGDLICWDPCGHFAYDYFECAITDSNNSWGDRISNGDGLRNPDIDVYGITVFDDPPESTVEIFQNNATGYFNVENAYELTGALSDVLDQILNRLSTITITRVVPIPE